MHNVAADIAATPDMLIIQKVLEGDVMLFELLIRRYNSVLYRIARSYGFNHQDAQDLLQDSHVAAYMALQQFHGRSSYKTWISRIMVNKCLYKLKYGYYKNEILLEQVDSSQSSSRETNQNSTEKTVLNRELSVILEKALDHIAPIYRIVFVLREMEGFSVAETADLLDITPINVKVRLSRAKVLLQQQVERYYAHGDLYAFHLRYCDAVVAKVFDRINNGDYNSGVISCQPD